MVLFLYKPFHLRYEFQSNQIKTVPTFKAEAPSLEKKITLLLLYLTAAKLLNLTVPKLIFSTQQTPPPPKLI